MCVLKVKDLCMKYRTSEVEVDVLKNINLEIEEGEFVVIMGPSGSGKSTLLYLMGGLEIPTSGDVILNGTVISSLDDMELSKIRLTYIGFIFQFFNLVPILNIEENVLLPVLLDKKDEKLYYDKLNTIIDMVGLSERRKHTPSQLSGGQQQRVAIARSLINDPKIILADEPTGNLDTKTSSEIITLLRSLCIEHKKTIVIVTHNQDISQYATRVIKIVDGVIVENKKQ